jgi:hypothetical protein
MKRREDTYPATELLGRRRIGRLLTTGIALALLLMSASHGAARPAALEQNALAAAGLGRQIAPATGQVTASGGKFWVGPSEIKLRGMNVAHQIPTPADLDKLAGWGFNFLRYQFHWGDLELVPPTFSGGRWNHTWDAAYMNQVKQFVNDAYLRGFYILIDNHGCGGCGYFGYPDYLYDAPYNSKATTYPETEEGAADAATDFWTDSLRQQHLKDMWSHVAGQLKNSSGIVGYEVMNEPQQGNLIDDHDSTALVLQVQLDVANAIRAADPARVISFATRAGYGPGLPVADLSGWELLGNVAFDLHDYFGARWGDGLGGEDPQATNHQEVLQSLHYHILADDGSPPYIGTTQVQVEFMAQAQTALGEYGIPLLIGEGGIYVTDPGAAHYFATMVNAANYLGVSWAVSAFEGELGILYQDGTPKPYAQIVIDAAQAP